MCTHPSGYIHNDPHTIVSIDTYMAVQTRVWKRVGGRI